MWNDIVENKVNNNFVHSEQLQDKHWTEFYMCTFGREFHIYEWGWLDFSFYVPQIIPSASSHIYIDLCVLILKALIISPHRYIYKCEIEPHEVRELFIFIYLIPFSGENSVLFTEEEKIPFIDSTLTSLPIIPSHGKTNNPQKLFVSFPYFSYPKTVL